MPRVKIEIREGRTQEHKTKLLNSVHEALVEAIKIPDHDRIQTLYEHKPENFELPPQKTELFTLIEITMFPGRSIDAKRNLYKSIVYKLQEINISETDIMIVLIEPPMENWGFRGKPASEINIGFKIDV